MIAREKWFLLINSPDQLCQLEASLKAEMARWYQVGRFTLLGCVLPGTEAVAQWGRMSVLSFPLCLTLGAEDLLVVDSLTHLALLHKVESPASI